MTRGLCLGGLAAIVALMGCGSPSPDPTAVGQATGSAASIGSPPAGTALRTGLGLMEPSSKDFSTPTPPQASPTSAGTSPAEVRENPYVMVQAQALGLQQQGQVVNLPTDEQLRALLEEEITDSLTDQQLRALEEELAGQLLTPEAGVDAS